MSYPLFKLGIERFHRLILLKKSQHIDNRFIDHYPFKLSYNNAIDFEQ